VYETPSFFFSREFPGPAGGGGGGGCDMGSPDRWNPDPDENENLGRD
jgi:hypothetical protein